MCGGRADGEAFWFGPARRSQWSLLLLFLTSVTGPARADEALPGHFRVEAGSFFTPKEIAYAEAALVWSPEAAFDSDGYRLRLGNSYGTWQEIDPHRPMKRIVTTSFEGAIGGHWRWGEVSLTAYLGAVATSAQGNEVWSRFGARLTSHLVWSPRQDLFVSLFGRFDSLRSSLGATIVTGWTTPLGVKLGPELGVSTSSAGQSLRAGIAITGIDLLGTELCVSGGIMRTETHHAAFYGGLYLQHMF